MDISGDCFQDILHNCTNNHLTGYSWWVGRNGSQNRYWHGHGLIEQGCACHMEPGLNCSDNHGSDNLCNCDDRNEGDIDKGTLRGFDQLPVLGLYYGDSETRTSWLRYDLGRLHCSGQKVPFPSQSVFMKQIDKLTKEVAKNNETLSTEIDDLTIEVRKKNDKLSNEIHYLLPVGTIIPWVPGPSLASQELETNHYSGEFSIFEAANGAACNGCFFINEHCPCHIDLKTI